MYGGEMQVTTLRMPYSHQIVLSFCKNGVSSQLCGNYRHL